MQKKLKREFSTKTHLTYQENEGAHDQISSIEPESHQKTYDFEEGKVGKEAVRNDLKNDISLTDSVLSQKIEIPFFADNTNPDDDFSYRIPPASLILTGLLKVIATDEKEVSFHI